MGSERRGKKRWEDRERRREREFDISSRVESVSRSMTNLVLSPTAHPSSGSMGGQHFYSGSEYTAPDYNIPPTPASASTAFRDPNISAGATRDSSGYVAAAIYYPPPALASTAFQDPNLSAGANQDGSGYAAGASYYPPTPSNSTAFQDPNLSASATRDSSGYTAAASYYPPPTSASIAYQPQNLSAGATQDSSSSHNPPLASSVPSNSNAPQPELQKMTRVFSVKYPKGGYAAYSCDQCWQGSRKCNRRIPTCDQCTKRSKRGAVCTWIYSDDKQRIAEASEKRERLAWRGTAPVVHGPQEPVYAPAPVAHGPQGPVYAPEPSGSSETPLHSGGISGSGGESQSTSKRRAREESTPTDNSTPSRSRRQRRKKR